MRQKFLTVILFGFIGGVFISSFVNFGWSFAFFLVFLGGIFGIIYFKPFKSFGAVALLLISIGLGQLRYNQSDLNSRQSDLQNKNKAESIVDWRCVRRAGLKEKYIRLVLETEKKEIRFWFIFRIILTINTETN